MQSRCGLLCDECKYREEMNCKGCSEISKPFWGDVCPVKSCCEDKKFDHCGLCTDFPCTILNGFSFDKEQGDEGRRIEQCRLWAEKR